MPTLRFVKAVLVVTAALGLAATGRADFIVDNSTVTILPTSSAAFGGYPRSDALDQGTNRFVTDFASASLGTATQLDFDFGTPITFTQIRYTDRTTSGGPNGVFAGGTFDFVTQYQYIFATDAAFTNIVGTLTVGPRPTPSQPTTIASFQTTSTIPNFTARYLRWDVITANGVNPGAADFQFTGADPVVPEPSSLVLGAMGAVSLLGYGWRRWKKAPLA